MAQDGVSAGLWRVWSKGRAGTDALQSGRKPPIMLPRQAPAQPESSIACLATAGRLQAGRSPERARSGATIGAVVLPKPT